MTARRLAGFVAAVVLTAVCSPRGAAARAAADDPGGRRSLRHGDLDRSYVVRLPATLPRDGKVPLVLVLHGGGGRAEVAERISGFTRKAREAGFIVVYPEGTGRRRRGLLTWNAGHCCGHTMERRVDDVGFVDALLDRLLADHPVDPQRIYVTGMSNGGMMTHRLGAELGHRFAAVATVVGTVFGDEPRPRRPLPALMLNGMNDASVPFAGGPPGGFAAAWDGTPARPALDQGKYWAEANGCGGEPEPRDRGAFRTFSWRCPEGRDVELVALEQGGHAWPGGARGRRRADDPEKVVAATDRIWEFFRTHPKGG